LLNESVKQVLGHCLSGPEMPTSIQRGSSRPRGACGALIAVTLHVAFIYLMLGEFHRGAAAVEQTREITERSGDLGESAFRWSNRGRVAFYRGGLGAGWRRY